VTYIITQSCVDVLDKTCIDECPVDCIYEGERMLYIQPDECVDCGACEPVCPVEAIYFEDDLPRESKDYHKVNVEFFTHLGSPGGNVLTRPAALHESHRRCSGTGAAPGCRAGGDCSGH
jgi:NAD-dependent dihydropyrimidine dehydrogenase PreA subunit